MKSCHDSPVGGHSGIRGTLVKVQSYFYWPNMVDSITAWVKECDTCLRCKVEHCASPGLLQPLPIPQAAWQDISLDFVEGLPRSKGWDTILVVVDRFTKYAHFIPLSHPYTAESVAQAFLANVFKLHGMRKTIVSDRESFYWVILEGVNEILGHSASF